MQVTATNTTDNSGVAQRKSGDKLEKDDFLKILVTQLSHQDPLKPMDDTQFISQMAQFTSLEQMQNLNKAAQLQTATTMIGKVVKAEVMGDQGSELVYGQVVKTREKDGEMYLTLDNGREIKSSEAKTVLGTDGLLMEAQDFVGEQLYIRVSGSGDEEEIAQVTVADVKVIQGDSGMGAVKFVPEDLKIPAATLENAKKLIGQDILVKQYDQKGKEAPVLKRITVTDAKWVTDVKNVPHLMLMTSDNVEDAVEYKDYYATDQMLFEFKDIWNVTPDEGEVEGQ